MNDLNESELINVEPSEKRLKRIWNNSIKNGKITPATGKAIGIVLGGQPGSGKSVLTDNIKNQTPNVVCINGDEYRSWHPKFSQIQEKYGKDSSKITAKFAGKVTEYLINRAIKEKYNVVIEGTFRTAETPLKTLKELKDNGYKTFACIKTCPAEISWSRCLARYEIGLKDKTGKERFTDRSHHDLVVKNLAKNADIVFKSGIPVIMSDIEICAECSTSHKIIDGLKGQGKVHDLCYDILNFFSEYNRKRNVDSSPIFDLVPVMHMLHPELFITRKCQVDIELDGKYTRGMSVVSEGDNCLLIEHLKDNTLYNNYFLEDLNILERNNSGN